MRLKALHGLKGGYFGPNRGKTVTHLEVRGAVVFRSESHPHQQTSCPFISPHSQSNSRRGWKPSAKREGGHESKNNKKEKLFTPYTLGSSDWVRLKWELENRLKSNKGLTFLKTLDRNGVMW